MRILIAAPFLFLLVLFALSNPQSVRLGLWPTDFALEAPLSITILAAMAVAFLAGALVLWASLLGARARARRAERSVRRLEGEVEDLKARLSPPPMPALPGAPPRRDLVAAGR